MAKRGKSSGVDKSGGDTRGMGNLVGGGPSIVGVSGSMRARDVSRPTAEQIEAGIRQVVIRRRPPEKAATPAAPTVPKPGPPPKPAPPAAAAH